MTDDAMLTFRLPSDEKRKLDAGGFANSSAVCRALVEEYNRTADTVEAALLVEREQHEQKLRELNRERTDIENDISQVERDIDRIDRRLEQRRTSTPEEAKELAEKITDGAFPIRNLEEDNVAVQNYAAKAGTEVTDFILDVREELD